MLLRGLSVSSLCSPCCSRARSLSHLPVHIHKLLLYTLVLALLCTPLLQMLVASSAGLRARILLQSSARAAAAAPVLHPPSLSSRAHRCFSSAGSSDAATATAMTTAAPSPPTPPLDITEQILEHEHAAASGAVGPSTTGLLQPYWDLIHAVSEGFLALPGVLHLSYATSIVLVTLVLRSSITLPLTFWQRRRVRRIGEKVVPELKSWMSRAKYTLRTEYRKRNMPYDAYVKELNRRVSAGWPSCCLNETELTLFCPHVQVAQRYKELTIEHKCRPIFTLAVPPLAHLPVFISMTMALREACRSSVEAVAAASSSGSSAIEAVATSPSTGLALEAFQWCGSLAEADPLTVLPVAVGLAAMANVEVQARKRETLADKSVVDDDEAGQAPSQARASGAAAAAAPRLAPQRPAAVTPRIYQQRSTLSRSVSSGRSKQGVTLTGGDSSEQRASAIAPPSTAAIRSKAITNVLRFASIMFVPVAAFTPVVRTAVRWTLRAYIHAEWMARTGRQHLLAHKQHLLNCSESGSGLFRSSEEGLSPLRPLATCFSAEPRAARRQPNRLDTGTRSCQNAEKSLRWLRRTTLDESTYSAQRTADVVRQT